MVRIKEILKEKNISIGELAERLGVSRQALGPQLRGRIQLQTLERMAAVIGVPTWKLLASEDEVKGECGGSDFAAFVKWRGESRMFATPRELKAFAETLPDDGD